MRESENLNKKFLKTVHSISRTIAIFCLFHSDPGAKNYPKVPGLYFTSPRTAFFGSSDLSKGEVNWKPGTEISEYYLFQRKKFQTNPKRIRKSG